MSLPERSTDVFIDRSLGKSVALALREAGFTVRTLSEVYGEKDDALIQAGVRAFCLTNGNLKGSDQIQWILNNLDAIVRTSQQSGPYIYGIYENRLKRLFP